MDLPDAPARWGDMRQHVFWGALYHWFVLTGFWDYRNFRPHRKLTVGQEFLLYWGRAMTQTSPATDPVLPVLLPFRATPPRRFAPLRLKFIHAVGLVGLALVVGGAAHAQSGADQLSALGVIWKWFPLLMSGFLFNILISILSMSLGTIAGLGRPN
eukprot:gene10373-12715_t